MKYISTRDKGHMPEKINSAEAIKRGLAPDGGLYLPESIPTTEEKRDLAVLEGDIPSPVNPPQGCKFHTRCAHCTEICKHAVPEWREMAPGHFVACHHPLGEKE